MDFKKLVKENGIVAVSSSLRVNKKVLNELRRLTGYLPEDALISQRLYHVANNIGFVACANDNCNKGTRFLSYNKGYKKFCSAKCNATDEETKSKRSKTCLKKYGSTTPLSSKKCRAKSVKTWKNKYGCDNPMKSSEVRKKAITTCLKKYGADSPLESKKILKKIEKFWDKKDGSKSAFGSKAVQEKVKETLTAKYPNGIRNDPEIVQKIKQTRINNYFYMLLHSDRLKDKVTPLFNAEEYNHALMEYKWQCNICGHVFTSRLQGRVPICRICYPKMTNKSKFEQEIFDWLKDVGVIKVVKNDRKIIAPYELDIYLPDYNLAIEFNGLFSHSEIGGNKDRSYHLMKTDMCNKSGVQLIHIFEDEWVGQEQIVKSIILNKIGKPESIIYARKCLCKIIDAKTAKQFVFDNHLQGHVKASKYFGLYCDNKLVYMISLGSPRFNKKYEYELLRSCSKCRVLVVGGFDKLLKYAVQELHINNMISYVDRRYFNGKSYEEWEQHKSSSPSYFYIKNNERENRMKYQKHLLKQYPEFDVKLTEWQIMQLRGYDRIWDCGNLVFSHIF